MTPVTDERRNIRNSGIVQFMHNYEADSVSIHIKSYPQKIDNLIIYECFQAFVLPESLHGQMLLTWRNSTNETPDTVFHPCEIDAYNAMINIYSAPKSKEFPLANSRSSIHGRGASHPSIIKLQQSCNYLHHRASMLHLSPTNSPDVKERFKVSSRNYKPNGAPSVDPIDFLPRMFEACFVKDKKSILEKVRNWQMILLSISHFYRPSEACQYCPLVSSVELPKSKADIDVDGVPKWLVLSLSEWKGRKSNGKYEMLLYRNYVDVRFCPVVWLLLWIQMSGIKQGPIICRIDADTKHPFIACKTGIMHTDKGNHYTVYLDHSNRIVNILYDEYSSILRRLFSLAGYRGLKPYTIRKFSVKWGARCGAKDWHLKNTGRWQKTSSHFHAYVQEGISESEQYCSNGKIDEIRKLWVYRPTTFHKNIAPEFDF